ncbi:MAG: polysaccharide deacetylase family protein [Lutibacter sp.]|jgi:peptidoglycan/xylan/chitin deacetylase (PgdA/CDA1 family)|nr:polysaccharide deacetylase family protein [Lutibacter sp.]MDP3945594.1 polysaccharide deacetylase family protein [Lutibacter sp.]
MLTVSNYHYIRENFEANYPSIFGLTPSVFEKQLLSLNDIGKFIHPTDLIKNLDEILQSKQNYLLVTFDDGLKEQFEYGLPILDELGIPAIFFANSKNFEDKKVSTVHKIHLLRSIMDPADFLNSIENIDKIDFSESEKNKAQKIYVYDDKKSAELKYLLNFKMAYDKQELIINKVFNSHFEEAIVLEKLYMSNENLLNLAKRGYLGSHTHNHYPLGLIDLGSIKFELEHSKLYFETLTNSKIEMVAYPYGNEETCTLEVAAIAKNVGYKIGFTTKRGNNTLAEKPLLLNRFDCNDLPGGKNYK